ncbi:MAG: hypothetical protein AAFY03_12855, partial [Pseudomonadota bacterium]
MTPERQAHQTALDRIAAAKAAGATRLELFVPQPLTAIPAEVADLPLREVWTGSTAETFDISALENLPNLEVLRVSHRAPIDLAQLGAAPNLRRLEVRDVPVLNVGHLNHCPAFDTFETRDQSFYKGGPMMDLLGALRSVTGLRSLRLRDCDFDSLDTASILGDFIQLHELDLSHLGVYEQHPPEATWFTELDLEIFSPLKNLRRLGLYDANLDVMSPLRNHLALQSLDIGKSWIKDPSFLEDLGELEELFLADCHFPELAAVSSMPGLRTLWAACTPAQTNITWVAKLPKLETLSLRLETADLAPLQELPNLKELWLVAEAPQDLDVLGKLATERQGFELGKLA